MTETPVKSCSKENQRVSKISRKRCNQCRKKLRMTDFICRCGNTFCHRCRFADKHECTFDYQSLSRDNVLKILVKVKPTTVLKF